MPPKLRSKTIVESLDSGFDAAEAARKGRVLALVEQIENLMNCNSGGIHPTTQLNKWKEEAQVMWTCLFFYLIILMNIRLSCNNYRAIEWS